MDISPSYSDILVSMDEFMDVVRSLEVEYIDDHESTIVDSIDKVCRTLYISEHVKAACFDLFSRE
ncbi:hypothetical protein H5410_061235 [Solanum commersonii]|uniref:Uncharacterized protein n=1 Tax=Solanum commersonii TaxID=4109 RepID=A0A9J5W770_SOLCO|nr:hypothetical protein H5410_061235 [Solanum commersonii]